MLTFFTICVVALPMIFTIMFVEAVNKIKEKTILRDELYILIDEICDLEEYIEGLPQELYNKYGVVYEMRLQEKEDYARKLLEMLK